MVLEKPVIFFSHSSRDKVALKKLKERFDELTGGTIDVFLSSDGQSIRLGSNWVSSIEKALEAAKIMFVFVSPNSLGTPWLYFETGHAFSKKIDVVPVGLFGVDIGKLSPPINLLQGFNLTDAESMNNIIAKVNEVFGTKHKLAFASEDYAALERQDAYAQSKLLGKHGGAVAFIELQLGNTEEGRSKLLDALSTQPGFMRTDNGGCAISGMALRAWKDSGAMRFTLDVDPFSAAQTLPTVEKAMADALGLTDTTSCRYTCIVRFDATVGAITQSHRQMARLVPPLEITKSNVVGSHPWLDWNGRSFWVSEDYIGAHMPRRQVELVLKSNTLMPLHKAELAELINLLFEREVLYFDETL